MHVDINARDKNGGPAFNRDDDRARFKRALGILELPVDLKFVTDRTCVAPDEATLPRSIGQSELSSGGSDAGLTAASVAASSFCESPSV